MRLIQNLTARNNGRYGIQISSSGNCNVQLHNDIFQGNGTMDYT